MKRPASIRDVAARSGYSKSTVSLVFKGDPSIPERTAAKIRRAARELNYRPNPLVVSLMSTLRMRKSSTAAGPVIVYLTASPTRNGWKRNRAFERYFAGAQTRCNELGYRLEHFWVREPGMTRQRVEQIFAARGIRGIVIGPVPTGVTIDLDWQRFALAKIGFSFRNLPIHTVANHHMRTMTLLLEKLTVSGKRRIGFLIPHEDDIRVERNWSAGRLLYENKIDPAHRLPIFDGRPTREAVLSWFFQNNPQVIVTTSNEALRWFKEAQVKIPEQVSFVHLDADPSGEISGMNQHSEILGIAAVDLVVEQLNYNTRGIPLHPRIVLTEATWFDGKTASLET